MIMADESKVVLSQEEYCNMIQQLETQAEILHAMRKMQQQMKEMQKQMNVFSLHFCQIYQKATTDKLTHLQNREGMEDFIKAQILPHLKQGGDASVVMFDIDHFKKFNDKYGHDVGDRCLQQVADILDSHIRQEDNSDVFRWGGEEIVAILPVSIKHAADIAERLRKAVEQTPFYFKGNESATITVSGGVAQFEKTALFKFSSTTIMDIFENVLKEADIALYQAKEKGRNQIVIFNENTKENKK